MKTEATLALPVFFFFPLPSSLPLPFTFSPFQPISLSPPAPMRSCRGVAAESFAGAAGTVSQAFIFGSGVLTLSNPFPHLPGLPLPFAKSVITMRPVRSTYPKPAETEPWRSRARQPRRKRGIGFLYELSN